MSGNICSLPARRHSPSSLPAGSLRCVNPNLPFPGGVLTRQVARVGHTGAPIPGQGGEPRTPTSRFQETPTQAGPGAEWTAVWSWRPRTGPASACSSVSLAVRWAITAALTEQRGQRADRYKGEAGRARQPRHRAEPPPCAPYPRDCSQVSTGPPPTPLPPLAPAQG